MTEPLTLPCPTCGTESPATWQSRNYRRDESTWLVVCEQHGCRTVTLR